MPLFGRKHHDKTKADVGHNDDGYEGQKGHNSNSGVTESGGGNRLHKDQRNDPLHPSSNTSGDGYGQQQRETGAGAGAARHTGFNDKTTGNDPYATDGQRGYGAGGAADATGGAARHGMTPQTDASGNPAHLHGHGGGGGGQGIAAKTESAMGSMLGSEGIKRKVQQKDQESQALKVQAAELGEAERLEQEAFAARQRAVAHGAHPEHQHLGSHNPGAGTQNVNEHGGNANTGMSGAGAGTRGGY